MKLSRIFRVTQLKRSAVAKAAGITSSYLCEIEKGRRTPSLRVALALRRATGNLVEMEELVAEKNTEESAD
ncbi:MAG: helix-turn-helix transcriptional regulator [Rickettsiales bacterium]